MLLGRVRDMLTQHRFQVVNVDGTIIAQRPKLSPHIPDMRKNIAAVLSIREEQST